MLGHGVSIVRSGLVMHLDAANTKSYIGSGTTSTDLLGSGSTLTLTNGPTYSTDNRGYFSFDGTNDYAILNNNQVADALTDMTVSIWVYRDWTNTYGVGTASSYRPLISKVSDIGAGAGWDLGLSANRTLAFYTQQSGGVNYNMRTANVSSILSTASWANIVASYSGGFNGLIRLYLNSNELTTNFIGSGTVASMSTTANICYAARNGGSADTAPVKYNNIRMSATQIYNRQLTNAEVLQNFNALRGRYGI